MSAVKWHTPILTYTGIVACIGILRATLRTGLAQDAELRLKCDLLSSKARESLASVA
jgi:hypothetical protein